MTRAADRISRAWWAEFSAAGRADRDQPALALTLSKRELAPALAY